MFLLIKARHNVADYHRIIKFVISGMEIVLAECRERHRLKQHLNFKLLISTFRVMKKHLLAALSILALAAAGCKEETKNYPPATVEIQNIVPQDVSVQFELAHTNAVSVGYRIEDADNVGKKEFTVIETSGLKTIVCEGLTQETDYQITAVAYNENGDVSKEDKKTFRTERTPAAPASAEIKINDITFSSVTFTITVKDAVSYSFGVSAAGSEPEMIDVVPDNPSMNFTVKDLTAETDYRISVIAYNADNVAAERIEKDFRTGVFVPFGEITSVATAHGIFIKTNVDTQKYPTYFLQVFDPEQTYVNEESVQFKVDSKKQFVYYLQTAILNPDIRRNSFQESNKTRLSSKSDRILLYAVPVIQNGANYICDDYGTIVEHVLEIPEKDIIGQSDAAILLGDPDINEDILTVKLTKQGEPVAYYTGVALKSEVNAAGGIGAYAQQELDAKKLDYSITSITNFKEEMEVRDLALNSDYVLFSFAYDVNGKIGSVQSKEFSTSSQFEYKNDISVDVALKEVAFTSAVFTVKRTNFRNGKYNFVTMKDFAEKYDSSIDNYVMQELIGQQSSYPISLYSDNDIKGSRLQYNTDYILIVLPESDQKDGYGKPATVRFHTKAYEKTSDVTLSLTINKVESYYGSSFASVTVTPSGDCVGYYMYLMEKSVFDAVTNLGETVCKMPTIKYRSSSEEQTFNSEYFFNPSYLVLIPVDKEGRFGAPVHSDLLQETK